MRFNSFFYGGLELDGGKSGTMRVPISNAALPNVAIVPLLQHRGAPALPLVVAGDVVRESMRIGAAAEDGADVHSPIPGVVREIRDVTLPDGRLTPAVVIELAGAFDNTGRSADAHPWENLSPEALIGIIADMGVCGLGAGSTPTHIKLKAALVANGGQPVANFIVNAVESEPGVTVDYRLLVERADAVISGIRIVRGIIGAVPTTVALGSTYRAVFKPLREALKAAAPDVAVRLLPDVFPQDDERLLSQTLLGVDQPRRGPDLNGSILVLDVATLAAIHDAVVFRKPLIERVLTVTGDAVGRPLNLRARVGTPISWLLEECGGLKYLPDRIVIGGPLTGYAIVDPDTPVTKETRAVQVLGPQEINYAPERTCIRCGACVRVCPSGLEPLRLAKLVLRGEPGRALSEDLGLCSECGLCSHVCPSRVPLVRILRDGLRGPTEAP